MPASESLPPPLPESLEMQVYEICIAGEQVSERLAGLRASRPEHAAAIDRLAVQLRRADTAVGTVRAVACTEPGALAVGGCLGPYRIVRELGRGGFGSVYLAEQERPVRRTVAIKVISAGLRGGEMLARFAAERQVLAQLQHPSIARILDAGATDDGLPYFVMEYLPGTAATTFADGRRLDVRARLELFLTLCTAVQYAHQRGIVHRDLKPGNVLVDEVEGELRLSVIDFGLAKALRDDAFEGEPSTTEFGRLLGTPEYMSPEQAAGLPIDTRTDVYSLGVILFELLAGSLPFSTSELRSRGLASVVKTLTEAPAPLPSERMRAAVREGRADLVAAARRMSGKDLLLRLRGDLDRIVAACLEKDRERRYSGVAELAADVRRHLAHQPISVVAPGAWYVTAKFVRRHYAIVAAAGAMLAALLISVVAASWSLINVSAARDDAVASAQVASSNAYAAAIAAAAAAGEAGRANEMRAFLADADAGRRDLEWRLLAAQTEDAVAIAGAECRAPHQLVPWGDGALFVDELSDVLYRWSGGAERATALTTMPTHVSAMAPAAEPGALLVGCVDGVVEYHTLGGVGAGIRVLQQRWRVGGRGEFVNGIARLGGDGEFVASVGERLLRLRVGMPEPLAVWREHAADIRSVDAVGDLVASGDVAGLVCVRDADSGSVLQTLAHPAEVVVVRLHPEGRTLATACRDGVIRLWSSRDGKLLGERETQAPLDTQLRFVGAGTVLVSTHSDAGIRLWDAETLRDHGHLRGHASFVSDVVELEDGLICTASWDGTLRTFRAAERRRAVRLEGMLGTTYCMQLHPSQPLLAACSLGGELAVWNLDDHSLQFVVRPGVGMLHGLAWDADGTRLFAGGNNGELLTLDAAAGEIVAREALTPGRGLRGIHRLADDRLRVVIADGEVWCVDPSRRTPNAVLMPRAAPFAQNVIRSAIDAAGTVAVMVDLAGPARAVDLRSGRLLWLDDGREYAAVCLAPEGDVAYLGSGAGEILAVEVRSRREVRQLPLANGGQRIYDLACSADGRRLWVADQRFRIVQMPEGRELMALDGDRFDPGVVCVVPERGLLAFGGGFFTAPAEVLVWPLGASRR